MSTSEVKSFDVRAHTIAELLQSNETGFYIPVYQRPYSWQKNHIARFFEDLAQGLERLLLGHDYTTFLGTMIFVRASSTSEPGFRAATQVLQVIDGQQRLSTILMFLSHLQSKLQDAITNCPSDNIGILKRLAKRLPRMTTFGDLNRDDEDPDSNCPRLIRADDRWGGSETKPVYKSALARYLFAQSSDQDTNIDELPEIAVALEEIESQMSAFADEAANCEAVSHDTLISHEVRYAASQLLGSEPADDAASIAPLRLALLGTFLLDRVQIIYVEATDESIAFSLFEPLNSTGQSLTPIETLKPLVVQEEGGASGFKDSNAAQYLGDIDRSVNAQDAARKINHTKDLIVTFALADTGKKIGRSFDEQRAYLRRCFKSCHGPDSRDGFLRELASVAEFESETWRLRESPAILSGASDDTAAAFLMLRDSNHTIAKALLSRFHSDPNTSRNDVFKLIRAVAAFWVLWRLSRSQTDNIDHYYRDLMEKGLVEGDGKESPKVRICQPVSRTSEGDYGSILTIPPVKDVVAALRSILVNRGQIPDRDTWIRRVCEINAYGGKAIAKFAILAAHDDAIIDKDFPAYLRDGTKGSNSVLSPKHWNIACTVEHIAPQKLLRPTVEIEGFSEKLRTESLINKLGNLTLIPKKENSSLGARPWSEKRRIYEVLGSDDPISRQALLMDGSWSMAPQTQKLFSQGHRLVFCASMGAYSVGEWGPQQVRDRGEVIASRLYDRICAWLGL